MNPYFDFNDIEEPIKYQLSETPTIFLDTNYLYLATLNIRQNFYTLYDSIFGLSGEQSGTFYSYEGSNMLTTSFEDSFLFRAEIRLDAQIDTYERTVQTVFEAIGIVGGIYEILRIVTGTLVGIFIKNFYQYNTANEFKVFEESICEENQINKPDDTPIGNNNHRSQNKIGGQNSIQNMIK